MCSLMFTVGCAARAAGNLFVRAQFRFKGPLDRLTGRFADNTVDAFPGSRIELVGKELLEMAMIAFA